MVLCPKCNAPRVDQTLVFEHPDGRLREQVWSCRMAGCGWSGPVPNRMREVGLLARLLTGVRVKRVTRAMRSLQESGDLIIVRDGPETMEVVA